jgi:hypothetical protein
VTELLTRAADVVVQEAGHQDQFQGVDAIRVGWELTQIIRTWEAPAVLSPARALMRRAVQLFSDPNSFIMSSGHDLARYIPALAQIRIESGDTNALAEYAAWIRSASEERVDEYAIEAFEPLWRNPKNPEVSTVSEWLFNDPASPWSKLPWKRSHFHDPLESGLVSLPAFRRLVARELENQTVVGSMEWHAGPGINIRYRLSASTGGYHFAWPETDSPGDGAKVEVRRCDWVAWVLSKSKQIPFYNPFAPLTQRDEALRRATADLAGSN